MGGASLIGGDQSTPDTITADTPQAAQDKQIVVGGYAITVPADWDGTPVECEGGGTTLITITPDLDPCREDPMGSPDSMMVSFARLSPEQVAELTGSPVRPFAEETAGRPHHAPETECLTDSGGQEYCRGGAMFDGMVIQVAANSLALEQQVRDLVDTIAVIGDDGVPVPVQN